ncbi:uncharacterized protein LOC132927925 isoform X2 [Rhopalosiphum padi]|uniref:uncharacterized protein LOC132927925 isoform X2 n=1 Tax=Rhopalosiphum padi TaxID=40932 RepID=UPI00298DD9D1|nr:uncharacterized protein LOC132927925 isoform X2 [Rhopalosiphum padi]
MSRGIAVLFKLKYGNIGTLLDQKVRVGGIAELKVNQGKDIYVFYLVTKVLYHHKPAQQCLANALIQLRDRLADLCINLLIIPKLGCALDGLNWYEVRGMLHSTFVDRNIQIIVCGPENLQITRHVIATCVEKNIEFLECGGPETVKILPIELSNASENAIFTKCLNHFQLSPSLIDNGKWASVAKGQVVRGNSNFIIWPYLNEDVNFFQTLETQIDETRVMVPNLSVWSFPKSEIIFYPQFIALVKSKLADNDLRYNIVVCDPNMPAQAMPFTGKWPRGSATRRHNNNSPLATNAVAFHRGNNRIYGGRLRGHGGRGYGERGGHGGHTSTPSTTIYSEALRSIVSVVEMATNTMRDQPSNIQMANNFPERGRARGRRRARGRPPLTCHVCRAFGHLRRDCPKKFLDR